MDVKMLAFNLVVEATMAGQNVGLMDDEVGTVGAADGKGEGWLFPTMPDSGSTNPDPCRTTRRNNTLPIKTTQLDESLRKNLMMMLYDVTLTI
jgi:hypothetical protein